MYRVQIKIFWAGSTVKSITRWFRFLRANKDASSLWRADPSCKTAWNCVEIYIWIYSGTEGAKLCRQDRAEVWRRNFTSLQLKAGRKCRKSGTSDLRQSRQSGNAEAKLHIFESPCRDEKRNFTSLRMKAERKCGRSRNSDLWQSKQSGSAKAQLHTFRNEDRVLVETPNFRFGSQGRAEIRKRNFTSLEVQAKMTCGNGSSHLWKSWQKQLGSGTCGLWKSWQSEVRRADF